MCLSHHLRTPKSDGFIIKYTILVQILYKLDILLTVYHYVSQ
jgi:hypothetical protein